MIFSGLRLLENFAASCTPAREFFGFPTWYKYLEGKTDEFGKCVPTVDIMKNPQDLGSIGLVFADILIRISGLVAVGFIIYAGFQYMTSNGSPEKTAGAKNTIINALVGLVVAIIASAVVSFIGNSIR